MINRRLVDVPLILTALGALVVGCSRASEVKEYDVPKSLCGVSVAPELLARLLPSGQEVDVQEKNPVPSRKRCQVDVDGKIALMASQEWWGKTDSLIDVANAHPKLDSAQPTDSYVYLSSGTGAVGRVKNCASPDHTEHTLYAVIEVYAKDVNDAAAMKKLITDYTEVVETGETCR
ncbi:hypothetical protein [Streptomyces triticisoli]|uniref:hypothetical protein n=1 Tax=Streptomyces triticisoli TaxID=2182797 RepID=UPI000DD87CCD|nr:hypothetical protein [Streptomyces triticisoli]